MSQQSLANQLPTQTRAFSSQTQNKNKKINVNKKSSIIRLITQVLAQNSRMVSRLFASTSRMLRRRPMVQPGMYGRGLEQFFDVAVKSGETASAGRAWKAAELRRKSQVELHELWHVLTRERNMLASEKHAARRVGGRMNDASRVRKVRKSMMRIKVVLGERSRAHHEATSQEIADGYTSESA